MTSEAGSISPAAAASVALVAMLCLLTADVGVYLAQAGSARTAADAAALAAVQESFPLFATGIGPREAAERFAKANGARIEDLKISRGGDRVEVSTSLPRLSLLPPVLRTGPDRVRSRSAAEIDVDAFLASRWFPASPEAAAALRELISSGRIRNASSAGALVVLLAMSHLGKPYVFGAAGPRAFDCSGLVCYVYSTIGIRLPRVTFSQVHCGTAVSQGNLLPGDLVFFRANNHVGIYAGDGWFIHAPRTGDVVKVQALSSRSDVSACRRILR